MKIGSAAIILAASLAGGAALAAAAPDRCAEQEKALRTRAVEACSGLSYLFNPSGCFIAEKALKAFDAAECRTAVPPVPAVHEPPRTVTAAVPSPGCDMPEKALKETASAGEGLAELKAENARLKAEIERLRAELDLLRGKAR